MSEGTDLAAAAVGLISAAATGAAASIGSSAVVMVTDLVRSRLRAAGEDPGVVGLVEENPKESQAREHLITVLARLPETDPAFRRYLAELLVSAAHASVPPLTPQNTGSIVIGDGARVRGPGADRPRVRGTQIITGGPGTPDTPAAPRIVWENEDGIKGLRPAAVEQVGETGQVAVFTEEDALVGRDLRNGRVLWTVRDGEDGAPGSAVVPDGNVVANFLSGEIRALAPETGRVIWSHQIPYESDAKVTTGAKSIQFADGMVYVTTFDRVEALNPTTGVTVWSTRLESGGFGEARYARGTLLVWGPLDVYYVLDAKTGTVRWSKKISGGSQPPKLTADILFSPCAQASSRPSPPPTAARSGTSREIWAPSASTTTKSS
ncbi:PQQ-binding-like beta-propeller repeat protein [Streptomyces lavendulae]|uniref:PQQ-binding-like beta-propeller repeat protein n=1 Tax=Streptomyces lavendulae TaxID=1914 RepID=UPI0031E9A266